MTVPDPPSKVNPPPLHENLITLTLIWCTAYIKRQQAVKFFLQAKGQESYQKMFHLLYSLLKTAAYRLVRFVILLNLQLKSNFALNLKNKINFQFFYTDVNTLQRCQLQCLYRYSLSSNFFSIPNSVYWQINLIAKKHMQDTCFHKK